MLVKPARNLTAFERSNAGRRKSTQTSVGAFGADSGQRWREIAKSVIWLNLYNKNNTLLHGCLKPAISNAPPRKYRLNQVIAGRLEKPLGGFDAP